MRKTVIIIVLIITNLVSGYVIFKPKKQIQVQEYINKIDSLETELSSIKIKRDSIRERIDTIIVRIKQNEKIYKDTIISINNNSTNHDYVFFTEYLKWNSNRLNSINNSGSIKGN